MHLTSNIHAGRSPKDKLYLQDRNETHWDNINKQIMNEKGVVTELLQY